MKPEDIAIGITTCPRPSGVSYIDESTFSLRARGYPFPLVYSDDHLTGDFTAFKTVATLLLDLYPDKQHYIILQDDAIPCFDFGEFSERLRLDGKSRGVFSLFTTRTMSPRPLVFSPCKLSTDAHMKLECAGGIAYILNPISLFSILRCFHKMPDTTPTPFCLAKCCKLAELNYYVPATNFFEHIGKRSAVTPTVGNVNYSWNVSDAEQYRLPAYQKLCDAGLTPEPKA